MHSMTPAPWPGSSSSWKARSSLGPERRASSPRSITSPCALALSNPGEKSEARLFFDLGKLFALGRYSKALESYEAERARPGRETAPAREELIERLGGRILMERLRKERTADERYPAAMARLRRLLDSVPETIPSWSSSPIFWIGSHSPTPAEVRSWIGAE